ncbi:MAG: sodium/proton-translocating pyrophosphatase, partial [Planctomycetia bacterium]
MKKIALQNAKGPSRRGLWMMVAFMVIGLMGASGVGTGGTGHGGEEWHPFSLFSSDSNFTLFEKAALVTNLLVAFAGLFYARWLMTYVNGADNGTSVMQEIAKAVREGAYAYLRRQFTVVGVLILIIAGILVATKWPWHDPNNTTEIWV